MVKQPKKERSLTLTLLTLLMLAALALTACGGGGKEKLSGTLTHMTWGGAYTEADIEALLKPFTEEYGINYATVDAPAEMLPKLQAMQDAKSVTIDTIDFGPDGAFQAWSEGLLEPLPEDLKKDLVAECGEDLVTDFGLGTVLYSDIIVCNKDAVERCPTTAAEFFDVENFPGPRVMGIDDWYHNLMFALMADGVPRDQLFPLDVDRGFAKFEQIKPHIAVWFASGEQSQQVFRDEEVVMGYIWDGRAWALKEQGLNLEISYDGATFAYEYYVVVKDAPNKEAAFEFLRWYAENAEAQAKWMEMIKYGTCNPKAYDLLDAAVAEQLIGAHMDQAAAVNFDWLAANGPPVKERWYTWIGE